MRAVKSLLASAWLLVFFCGSVYAQAILANSNFQNPALSRPIGFIVEGNYGHFVCLGYKKNASPARFVIKSMRAGLFFSSILDAQKCITEAKSITDNPKKDRKGSSRFSKRDFFVEDQFGATPHLAGEYEIDSMIVACYIWRAPSGEDTLYEIAFPWLADEEIRKLVTKEVISNCLSRAKSTFQQQPVSRPLRENGGDNT